MIHEPKPLEVPVKALGARIRSIRKARGKTQMDIALLLDIAKQTVSAWETGYATPMITSLFRFCAAMGIEPEQLFSETPFEVAGNDKVNRRLHWTTKLLPLHKIGALAAPLRDGSLGKVEPARHIATYSAHSSDAFAVILAGRAMEPRFLPGDVVTIDPDTKPEPGQLALALHNNEAIFRRWIPVSGRDVAGSRLEATNGKYFPELVLGAEDLVIGVMGEHISTSHD